MNKTSIILALLLVPTLALAGGRVQSGDPARGAVLYKLHCAACHGPDGRGDGPLAKPLGTPAPADLRDVAFLMQRTDDDLFKAVSEGGRAVKAGFAMPAFTGQLGLLDLWDLVAFVRQGVPAVGEYFPDSAHFTARSYSLDADAQHRLEPLLGKLTPEESKIVVVAAFGGEKVAGDEPGFVPNDPRLLDVLKPKLKLGYLAFARVALPGVGEVPVCLALDKDGVLKAVKPRSEALSEADRAQVNTLLSGFEGQGSKKAPYQELKPPGPPPPPKGKKPAAKKPEPTKEAAETAKALTRAYLRAVEGASVFDKEERERHWAD
jgi:mono/diheme cytochrome c family protein